MAGLKELRRRLKSVNNTKKITYAMKLVSAAKLRRTQESVVRSRVYTDALRRVLAQLQDGSDFTHPLFESREQVKRVRLLILGGARGLCGAYNTNINRCVDSLFTELLIRHPGAEITSTIFGRKPAEYFRRTGKRYVEAVEDLQEDPQNWPIDEYCKKLEGEFLRGEFDELYVVYMRFQSALTQVSTAERLLPFDTTAALSAAAQIQNDPQLGKTLFEPSSKEVFDAVIPRIIRSVVRQAALDTKASEHASRMSAMDSATKNASDLIHTLTLKRNKLRQTGITSQLLDIVGGAEAIS